MLPDFSGWLKVYSSTIENWDMIGRILLLVLVVPFADLFLLVQVAEMIGFWQVLGIVLITGVVGAEVVRREGLYVLRKIQRSVTTGEMSRNMLEIGLLVGGGILLLLPGLITDFFGFLVIVRPVRERIAARFGNGNGSGNFHVEVQSFRM